jgi:surface protein
MAVRISHGDDVASTKSSAEPSPIDELTRESSADKASMHSSAANSAAASAAVVSYNSVISSMAKANKSNSITEENYYILQWLYRIRRVSCARGLRIGFLQPDFLCVIYRSMMCSKKLCRSDGDIHEAAKLWCSNRAAAEAKYGHISDWDTSSVTNMRELFRARTKFNDDISRWHVSKVTNMSCMFCGAEIFNQPIGDWDVSHVTDMCLMFASACDFNQPVGNWNVSNVTTMSQMFFWARSFNQPIGDWKVSKVTNMSHMFDGAQSFNQDLTRWDMRSVMFTDTGTLGMFHDAPAMRRDYTPFVRVRVR